MAKVDKIANRQTHIQPTFWQIDIPACIERMKKNGLKRQDTQPWFMSLGGMEGERGSLTNDNKAILFLVKKEKRTF